jgi:hypothetical protein
MKLELLTNAAVVDEALKFISTQTEKAKVDEITSLIEKESDDVQGSTEDNDASGVAIPTRNKTF